MARGKVGDSVAYLADDKETSPQPQDYYLKVLTPNVQLKVRKSNCQPQLKANQNKVKKPISGFFIRYAKRTEQVTCS